MEGALLSRTLLAVALGAVAGGFLLAGLIQALRPPSRRRVARVPHRQSRNVLFVCTDNLCRGPAAEALFRQIANGTYRTRSVGISRTCLHRISERDVCWADAMMVMEWHHRALILERWPEAAAKLRVLEIEDRYYRNDPVMLRLLEVKLEGFLTELESGEWLTPPVRGTRGPSRIRRAV